MSRSSLGPASISIWIVAGMAFPFVTPVTLRLSTPLEPLLVSSAGMAEEMAYYVAFTIARIPVTAALGAVVAAAHCAAIPQIRPIARRWIIAGAVGAAIATIIWLPSTLIARGLSGGTLDGVTLTLILMFGAALLCGLVSLAQRQALRNRFLLPGWIVVTSLAAAAIGAFASHLTAFYL
jgi:hypothetical protein